MFEPYYLNSIREQPLTWRQMACELIDNSLGADATIVRLRFGKHTFEIQDNGVGTDDLLRMVTLGRRRDQDTVGDIGRYGAGGKHAMIWMWGQTTVKTMHNGIAKSIGPIDWDKIANHGHSLPSEQIISDHDSGTIIRCQNISRRSPDYAKLLTDLGRLYTPGIEQGRKIVLQAKPRGAQVALPTRWPETVKEQEALLDIYGRSVHVKMGIVRDGHTNPYCNGFSFEHRCRVIRESTLGANGYSVGRIAARITIGREWVLSTHKDELNDTDIKEALGVAIHSKFADLMREASEQAMTFEEQAFLNELTGMLHDSIGANRRESRGEGTTHGTAEPADTKRKRRTAKESTEQVGSVLGRPLKRNGFTIEKYHAGKDSNTVGTFDADGCRIRINADNEWNRQALEASDSKALLPVIYGILSNWSLSDDARRMSLLKREINGDFSQIYGSFLERVVGREVTL